jgi:hypothetical protein
MRRALLILLALAASAPAWAQAPATTPEFTELWTKFSDNCLTRFPDDAAVATNAGDDGWNPLPAAQAKAFLRDGPGRGWMITGRYGVFVLTIEPPPSHRCVVRKNVRSVPKFEDRLAELVGDWSQDLSPPMHVSPLPPKDVGGETFYGFELHAADGRLVDTVGATVHQIPDTTQAELRLSRQRK